MVMMSPAPTSDLGKQNCFETGTKKDWGEEREDDVLYSIILKKVNRCTTQIDKMAEGLLYETQKIRHIKGATLPHLVKYLCKSFIEDEGERHFLTVFLATYRTFASSGDVLDLIAKECEELKHELEDIRMQLLFSTIRVLRTWLDRYFDEDFNDPPQYTNLKAVEQIANTLQSYGNVKANEFYQYVKAKTKSPSSKKLGNNLTVNNLKSNNNSPLAHHITNNKSKFATVNKGEANTETVKIFLNALIPQNIAEQLTLYDANLFLRVIPHHCLTAVRSAKDKPATVKATIDQFNRVVYCVLALCLCPGFKPTQRAKIICRWIEVAQACRELKNFSSLRAIISGLQTHPIHRLKKVWQHVPQSHTNLLKELGQINTKDSIQKVGTAKVNTEQSAIDRVRRDASERRQRDITHGITHGTVPFLGSFLTDLTYLHTARSDYIEKTMINFEKRRKEFELLAQLQLWQVSCRSYQHFESDTIFSYWFNSITLPTDNEAIKLSEELEPPLVYPPSPITPTKRSLPDIFHHQTGLPPNGSTPSSLVNRAKSAGKESYDKSPNCTGKTESNGHVTSASRLEVERTVNVQIIKKNPNNDESTDRTGRELKLSSNDRSPAFVRKAFNLFQLEEENVNKFKIKQILPDRRELDIPDNGNVYYAMNSSANEFNFVLVEEGANLPPKPSPNRINNKHKKNRKIPNPLSPGPSSSPMKSITRHLGFTDFFGANSGSYSLTKAANRYDAARDREKKEEDLEDFSDNESISSTSSSHKHRSSLWKKLARHDHVETYKPLDETATDISDSKSPDAQRSTSTWPRHQNLSSDIAKFKLHRRAAIRKHHTHPRDMSASSSHEGFLNDLSDERRILTRKSRPSSRSDDFVTFNEYKEAQRSASVDLLDCEISDISRYASDPCLVDSVEVFQTPPVPKPRRLRNDATSKQETFTTVL